MGTLKIPPIKIDGLPVISARDLAHFSASKCWYRMTHGYVIDEVFADAGEIGMLKSSTSPYVEMSVNTPVYNGQNQVMGYIYGSVDEMIPMKDQIVFREHKQCRKDPTLWFTQVSLIQLAIYIALGQELDEYKTSWFWSEKGNTAHNLNREGRYIVGRLDMAPYKSYDIELESFHLDNFKDLMWLKAYEIIQGWDRAQMFDWQMDGNERKHLLEYITYKELITQ